MARHKIENYFGQKNDYRVFVGVPLEAPAGWIEVHQLEGDRLLDIDLNEYRLQELKAWLVAYTTTGEVVQAEGLLAQLPAGITGINAEPRVSIPPFTRKDLKRGARFVEIQFGSSSTQPGGRYYSTELTNISDRRIRCLGFAAYVLRGGNFVLSTVTGTPCSARQFEEWYGVRRGGWINPGETACDPSNYGEDCCWVYFFELEDAGQFFVAAWRGKKSFLEKLASRLRLRAGN